MSVNTLPATLAVAAAIALACSGLVATAVTLLRPVQLAQAQIDRNRAIVAAAGFADAASAANNTIVARFLELDARVIDTDTGARIADVDAHGFDHWQAGDRTAQDPRRVPIYIARDGNNAGRLVLPIDGPGMWSTIRAYIALQPDLVTIADLTILSHGETPGIGDRIEDPQWLSSWRGKRLYDARGELRIDVTRNARGAHEVDLISGASVTSEALGEAVRHWFGDDGYRPLLMTLRTQGDGE